MLPTGSPLSLPFGVSIPAVLAETVYIWKGLTLSQDSWEIFKSEASFLKPVFCLITHTAQVYACTGIGLSY